MEMTYQKLLSSKEEELQQLTNRLRVYEGENRKLSDVNRTLQLTKERNDLVLDKHNDNLDKLSQIHHLDSHFKPNKENEDLNARSGLKDKVSQELQ